jgi:CMP-N,N'-diacetyllegionaminic acid synthase
MLGGRTFLGVVTARAGSVRIPGKNLMSLAGVPLIVHTLRAGTGTRHLDHLVVSTDGEDIAAVAREYDVEVIRRPADLAGPTARSVDAVLHAIDAVGGGFTDVVLLQPTSPLRTAAHVDQAIELYVARGARSLVSVGPVRPGGHLRRLDAGGEARVIDAGQAAPQDRLFCLNGAVYINEVASLTPDTVMNENRLAFVMDESSSVDVDDPPDLARAQLLMAARS